MKPFVASRRHRQVTLPRVPEEDFAVPGHLGKALGLLSYAGSLEAPGHGGIFWKGYNGEVQQIEMKLTCCYCCHKDDDNDKG